VTHETLWAPWRLGYIKGEDKFRPPEPVEADWLAGADRQCFICRAVASKDDRENLVVLRGTETVTILNRYPYNNGHLLIAPRLHKANLSDATAGEHLQMQETMARLVGLLQQLMNSEGFNIGLNLGRVAGAGLPGHLHWHIVPRWNGDTNFMPAVAGVKVIPQSLEALWELLHDAAQSER
jgi:ATP adenylyltransferase